MEPCAGECCVRKNGKVNMLIASKNIMFLEGIRTILRQDPSINIVGEACRLEDTLDQTNRLHPHVVLLDGVLTDESTLETIQRMRKAHEKIGILVLNVSGRLQSTARLLKAGASVYVSPETRIEQLFELIHATDSLSRQGSTHELVTRHKRNFLQSRRPDVDSLRLNVAPTKTLRAREGRRA